MRWAVLGSRGMLGSDLVEFLTSQGEEVLGFHRENLDIDPYAKVTPEVYKDIDVVVNCIAYTQVDRAEEQDQIKFAHDTNTLIPVKLAVDMQDMSSRLIHISTDYVFDGTKGSPYLPGDARSPLGVYGGTKALGEELVLTEFPNTQVIRTSWLYGKNGKCFPKTIGAKLAAGEDVRVVEDQFGSPTHTLDLAEFIYRAGKAPMNERILHGVSSGSTSWFEFAKAIAAQIPGSGAVSAVSSFEYPTKAQRPANSTLMPSSVAGWQIDPWDVAWERAAGRVLDF